MNRKTHKKKKSLILLQFRQNTPLQLWSKRIRAGHICQVIDQDLHCPVLEITSEKSTRTYITAPADPKETLGITAPCLHLMVKNLRKNFVFDVLVKDDQNVKRRFKASTRVKSTVVKPYLCKMPLILEHGWNDITIPLAEYTTKAYGTNYKETLIVRIHANCRLEKVYFTQTGLSDDLF